MSGARNSGTNEISSGIRRPSAPIFRIADSCIVAAARENRLSQLIAAIERDVGAERRQAEILEDETAQQQRRKLQGEDREADERDERNQADAGPRQRRRERRGNDEGEDDHEDAGEMAEL